MGIWTALKKEVIDTANGLQKTGLSDVFTYSAGLYLATPSLPTAVAFALSTSALMVYATDSVRQPS